MNIWVWELVLVASFSLYAVLCASSVFAAPIDASESIQRMQEMMLPRIQEATDWSMKVGLGLVSASAFYALVVRVIKL